LRIRCDRGDNIRGMPAPFTIRIFVPDGDPEGVRFIDRMGWTGLGLVFPRSKWADVLRRTELTRPGVYLLVGYEEGGDDRPAIYIGQTDGIKDRIEAHYERMDFWDRAIIVVSQTGGLNRAHVTWLEHSLIKKAAEVSRYRLINRNAPREPALGEAEKADMKEFLKEILQILPLARIRAFEAKAVAEPRTTTAGTAQPPQNSGSDVVIIVPAQKENFERLFLGEDCWYAIPISGGRLDKIRYIAAYQTQPVAAVTHYAPVDRIEPYGEEGKYKVIFSEKAKTINQIPFGDAPKAAIMGPRYTTFAQLMTGTKLTDLIGK